MRGNESATMLEPRVYNIALMGLGGSVGTPKEGKYLVFKPAFLLKNAPIEHITQWCS